MHIVVFVFRECECERTRDAVRAEARRGASGGTEVKQKRKRCVHYVSRLQYSLLPNFVAERARAGGGAAAEEGEEGSARARAGSCGAEAGDGFAMHEWRDTREQKGRERIALARERLGSSFFYCYDRPPLFTNRAGRAVHPRFEMFFSCFFLPNDV